MAQSMLNLFDKRSWPMIMANDNVENVLTNSNHMSMIKQGTQFVYEVEEVLDWRKGNVEYLVKWENYDYNDNTWEPIENLADATDLIAKFEAGLETGNNLKTEKNTKVNRKEFDIGGLKVERILDKKQAGLEYLVKWKNYDYNENTWEPKENLTGATDIIQGFENGRKCEASSHKRKLKEKLKN